MDQGVLVAIKSGLSFIETCLRDVLRQTKTDADTANWLFKVRKSDLDQRAACELADSAKKMLWEIEELQREFKIGRSTESVRWRVVNDLNQIWSTFSELSEEKLRGYGRLEREERRILATHLDRMETLRKDMERLMSRCSIR